jgi:UDP-N-acetylglucosamine--N-acetylmuramyl-(pentapeptide) pyrophosphoryl-undecaprenol N-acetylglucosamine transferase
MEAKIVAASGIDFAVISAGKFRRYHSASMLAKLVNLQTLGPNTRDAFRAVAGVADSLKILRRFRPKVIFLKGGFVCVPVGLAARLLRIPYVIHESDVTPGLANRILGRWAAKVAVGFPVKNYHEFNPKKLVYVGNPIRSGLMKAHRLEGLARFGFDDSLPVILVTGGSQGAAQINDAVVDGLPELLEWAQVIHLTGERDFERVQFELGRRGKLEHPERYHPQAFLMKEMAEALAAADIVVSRAGVNAITDVAALGKPTVLIPNYEMAGHQVENAKVLSRMGAVRVLDGRTLTAAKLVGELKHLAEDREEQERLSHAIRQFAHQDAAKELARVILDVGRAGERATEQEPNTENEGE